MKNLVYDGIKQINVPAPAGGVVGGSAVLLGALLAVPVCTAAAGVLTAFVISSGVDLPKAAQAMTIGAKLYWDDTNKVVTTTASGNTLCGTVGAAALSGDATVTVLLNFCP